MRSTFSACILLAALCHGQGCFAQDRDVRVQPGRDPDYQKGLSDLDTRQWDSAVAAFSAAAAHNGTFSDAALYWKAFAQNRSGRREDAFVTLTALRNEFPSSRWIGDARALEVEMRAKSGTPVSPGAEHDEELKLLAVNSLMQSDPNAAIPILQKLLASGNNPISVKERALFVLTQSPSPQARKLLDNVASGSASPELQMPAIRYIGMMGGDDSRQQLADLYHSSSDEAVKREVIQSFMVSGSKDFLLRAAKTEKNPDLQREAIRSLAVSGGGDQLWQLYQNGSSSASVKQDILKMLFLTGDPTHLKEVARSERNPELRTAAVKSLGLMGQNGDPGLLVSIYKSDSDRELREEVLNALFLQQDGKALVDLARNEKDPEWKAAIVRKMSLLHTKETTEYMMELLK